MRINCYDLPCPEPVLRVKKAIEGLPEDAILEVELNTVSSIANVQRFAKMAAMITGLRRWRTARH